MSNRYDSFTDIDEWHETIIGKIYHKSLNHIIESKINKFIKKQNRNVTELKILDAGCGSGIYSLKLAKTGINIKAIDKNEILLQKLRSKAQANLEIECNDICGDEFLQDQLYDLILCSNVIEFCANAELGLKNLKSVLKDSGLMIITAQNPYSIWGLWHSSKKNFVKNDFYQGKFYSQKEMTAILTKLGIEIIDIKSSHFPLSNGCLIYTCKKAS